MFFAFMGISFNTQPPEGGWRFRRSGHGPLGVSTHSRPKAAGSEWCATALRLPVSTHSRPKAAGCSGGRDKVSRTGFNTQPPEGGWPVYRDVQCFL